MKRERGGGEGEETGGEGRRSRERGDGEGREREGGRGE